MAEGFFNSSKILNRIDRIESVLIKNGINSTGSGGGGGAEAGSGLTKVGDTINMGGDVSEPIQINSTIPENYFGIQFLDTTSDTPNSYASVMYMDPYRIQFQTQANAGSTTSNSIMLEEGISISSDNFISIYPKNSLVVRIGSTTPTVGQALICTSVDGPYGEINFQDIPTPAPTVVVNTGLLTPTLTDGNGTTYSTTGSGFYRSTINPDNVALPGTVYYRCIFTITNITGTPGGNLYVNLNDAAHDITSGVGTALIVSSTATPFYSIQSVRNNVDRIAFMYQDSLDANNSDLYPADNLAIGDSIEFSIECSIAGAS